VRTRVGRSTFRVDLAVKKPGDALWRLAIVVDGPQWQARATVMDRDGAPELLHEMAGWPLVGRVWLPGWLRNREAVIARLVDLLENGPAPVSNEAIDPVAQLDESGSSAVDEGEDAPARQCHRPVEKKSNAVEDGVDVPV